MAQIYQTTLAPTKLELLTGWLPAQPWYSGSSRPPTLSKAGGFRLDDPAGEVGIEFIVVTDHSSGEPVTYLTPLTYRGGPLDGVDDALVGISEHGVLGRRWFYDGVKDPVLIAALLALMKGDAVAQMQSVSDTPDPSVLGHFDAGKGSRPVAVQVVRILNPGGSGGALPTAGYVEAPWQSPDGTPVRGTVAIALAR